MANSPILRRDCAWLVHNEQENLVFQLIYSKLVDLSSVFYVKNINFSQVDEGNKKCYKTERKSDIG